jgi:hypothetical protein
MNRANAFMISLCVVLLVGLASPLAPVFVCWCVALFGPACGSLLDRRAGGIGVAGGLLGGIFWFDLYGVTVYAWSNFGFLPGRTDYLGPELSFMLLTWCGAALGLITGIGIWILSWVCHLPAVTRGRG